MPEAPRQTRGVRDDFISLPHIFHAAATMSPDATPGKCRARLPGANIALPSPILAPIALAIP
jgi:hypothetical protein